MNSRPPVGFNDGLVQREQPPTPSECSSEQSRGHEGARLQHQSPAFSISSRISAFNFPLSDFRAFQLSAFRGVSRFSLFFPGPISAFNFEFLAFSPFRSSRFLEIPPNSSKQKKKLLRSLRALCFHLRAFLVSLLRFSLSAFSFCSPDLSIPSPYQWLNVRFLLSASSFSLSIFSFFLFPFSAAAQSPPQPFNSGLEPSPAKLQPLALSPQPFHNGPQPFEKAPPSSFAASGESATSAIGIPEFATEVEDSAAALLANPLQWGPFTAHPHISDSFTYATGLHSRPGGEQNPTAFDRLVPGITVTSPHLTITYTPTFTYYIEGPYADAFSQAASLSSHFAYGDWHFSISQRYQNSSRPLIETATQTETESFSTGLSASYQYTEKISFQLSATQQFRDTEDFSSSRQWSTMDWVNYHLTDSTLIGVGAGAGFVDVAEGTDMSYEQIQGHINTQPGASKISLGLNGGIEIRHFLGNAGIPDRLNPLMGASLGYRIFEHTSLSLRANRSVDTSIFQNRVTESTIVSASLSQRFLQRLNWTLQAGYRQSEYVGTNEESPTDRKDTYQFVSTSIGTRILVKGSLSVSYQHSIHSSSATGFGFNSDQYTAQVAYHF